MPFDAHANFAYSTVAVAPSPAASGTSLSVALGDGTLFPTPPFNVTVCPADEFPLTTNAEILRVTAIVGDAFTITREQEDTSARTIVVGDQIFNSITDKVITDLETAAAPGGADTSVQFNDGGAFGGFGTWDGSTLTVPGSLEVEDVASFQAAGQVDVIDEGFEGAFPPTDWDPEFDLFGVGTQGWTQSASVSHGGTKSAQGGAVPLATGYSGMSVVFTLPTAGTFSFWSKIDADTDARVYVYDWNENEYYFSDGTPGAAQATAGISGVTDWTQTEIALAAGAYEFVFYYDKMAASVVGQDTAWLDDVVVSYPTGAAVTVEPHVAVGADAAVDASELFYPNAEMRAVVNIGESMTDFPTGGSGNFAIGANVEVELNPDTDYASTSSFGVSASVMTKTGNANDLGAIYAFWGTAQHKGTGATSLTGMQLQDITNIAAANMANLRGFDLAAWGNTGASTITTATGLRIVGVSADADSLITTAIGIDIGDIAKTGVTTGYAIRTGTGLVSFGDHVQIAAGKSVQLQETASIALDPAGSADGAYSGITVTGVAGAALAFGDLIYLAAADSRWELVDADSVTTCGAVMTGMCVLAAAGDGSPTTILLQGIIRADAAFPNLTVGAPVYASTTAGDVQVAAPSGTDDVVHVLGYGMTANEMYFNPSTTYLVVA
jgi:hypothetical protein